MRVGVVLLNNSGIDFFDNLIGKEVEILNDTMCGLDKVYSVKAVIGSRTIYTCFTNKEIEDIGIRVSISDWMRDRLNSITKKLDSVGLDVEGERVLEEIQKELNEVRLTNACVVSNGMYVLGVDLAKDYQEECEEEENYIEEYINEDFLRVIKCDDDCVCDNCHDGEMFYKVKLLGNEFILCQDCIFDVIDYLVVKSNNID